MNTALKAIVLEDDIPVPPEIAPFIVSLAHEGVPIRALARAFKRHVDPIRECIEYALARADITNMPRDDWPPGTRPVERIPSGRRPMPNEELSAIISHLFKLTSKEADILTMLVRRPGPQTKEAILKFVYQDRDEPEVKIVDVFVCKIRKKLLEHNILITTVWGKGYTLENDDRTALGAKVDEYVAKQSAAAA